MTAARGREPSRSADDVPAGAYQVLAVVFLATVVISLSSTMLTIALPSMAADLDATASGTGWALTAYLLTNTASMMLMGQVADAVDRRQMLVGGLALFTVTSAGLALADEVGQVVVLRAVQGVGAAMLLCNAVAVLVTVFPGRLLGRAMGVPADRAGRVNAVRVTLQSTSLALATAMSLALAVAFVGPAAAESFVSGDAAALTAADVDGIVLGHRLLFGVFAMLVVAGAAVTAASPRRARQPR
ncbi:MFS transporter [Nocardioides ferulae]|uniref:MFS transporter n=1 Tax=Nocardioides ferulae TaxID=2340821 RepID=UPI000F88CAE9|nr:MFS transporter [Nocardioides ferulae]